MTRLRTRLTSHIAHEEVGALPLIGQTMIPHELSAITTALRGHGIRCAGTTVPSALGDASLDVREQVLSQLPAPARLLCRTVWLPRYVRATGPL